MKNILVVIRSAPYGTTQAKDALECALTAAVFGQKVSVLLMNDGVFNALRSQVAKGSGFKDTSAMLQSLPLYEIEDIFLCKDSLFSRGFGPADCVIGSPVSIADIKSLFMQQDVVLSY